MNDRRRERVPNRPGLLAVINSQNCIACGQQTTARDKPGVLEEARRQRWRSRQASHGWPLRKRKMAVGIRYVGKAVAIVLRAIITDGGLARGPKLEFLPLRF